MKSSPESRMTNDDAGTRNALKLLDNWMQERTQTEKKRNAPLPSLLLLRKPDKPLFTKQAKPTHSTT